MKKLIYSFSVVLLCSLFASNIAFATSGACSYHQGVNCSIGASYTGKVQCNDGWINSSVDFSDTNECKSYDPCPQVISGLSCTTESDYSQLQQQVNQQRGSQRAMNARSGTLGSSFDNSSSIGQDKLDSCRQAITIYNNMVSSRNSCLDQESKKKNDASIADGKARLDKLCVDIGGPRSFWNMSNNKCVSGTEQSQLNCKKSFGEYSIFIDHSNILGDQCGCIGGYHFKDNENTCTAIETPIKQTTAPIDYGSPEINKLLGNKVQTLTKTIPVTSKKTISSKVVNEQIVQIDKDSEKIEQKPTKIENKGNFKSFINRTKNWLKNLF